MKIILAAFLTFLTTASPDAQAKKVKKGLDAPMDFREVVFFKDRFKFTRVSVGDNTIKTELINASDKKVAVRLSAKAFSKEGEYGFDLSNIGMPQGYISLPPGGSTKINIKVNVSEDTKGSGAFRLSFEPEKRDSPMIISDSVVMFNVKNARYSRYEVDSKVKKKMGRLFIRTDIANTGEGILYGANIDYIIMNDRKEKVASGRLVKDFFLLGKGRKKTLDHTLRIGLPKGKYHIMTILSSSREPMARAIQSKEFSI